MCTKNLDDMIYSSWRIEHDELKLAIYGHFLPFNFPKTQRIKILKNPKNYLWCHQFAHVYQKSQSYDIRFPRCGVRQTEFFVISGHLFLNEKNAWMYPFICVHQRWQSWCMVPRYGVQQIQFFLILGHFLHFYPTNNPENQNFEKIKKIPGDIIILNMCIHK